MKLVNKKIISLIIVSFLLSVTIAPVLAQTSIYDIKNNLNKSADSGGLDTKTQSSIPTIIGQLINYLFGVLGIVFLAYAVMGGVLWMIAGGNDEKVARAVKFIIGGVEGLLVIFMAYVLVYVILAGLKFATQS